MGNYSRFAIYSNIQPMYAVLRFSCIKFVYLCDLSQNAPIKGCSENIKYFTKCVLGMLEM